MKKKITSISVCAIFILSAIICFTPAGTAHAAGSAPSGGGTSAADPYIIDEPYG